MYWEGFLDPAGPSSSGAAAQGRSGLGAWALCVYVRRKYGTSARAHGVLARLIIGVPACMVW